MRNLTDNAARHAWMTIELRLRAQDGTARLEVVDDGPGVPPADRGRVFERFVRLDASREWGSGGAGLGLPIDPTVETSWWPVPHQSARHSRRANLTRATPRPTPTPAPVPLPVPVMTSAPATGSVWCSPCRAVRRGPMIGNRAGSDAGATQ